MIDLEVILVVVFGEDFFVLGIINIYIFIVESLF